MDEKLRAAWRDLQGDPTDVTLAERYINELRRSGASGGISQQAEAVIRAAKKAKLEAVNVANGLPELASRLFISESISGAKDRFGRAKTSRATDKSEWQNAQIGVELLIERGMDPREIIQNIGAAPNTMSVDEIVEALTNGDRDLYFDHWESGARNVIYIPPGWDINLADEFPDEDQENEAYGYYATRLVDNDDQIETGWLNLDRLALRSVVSEREAREIHPALFEHLEKINRGEGD